MESGDRAADERILTWEEFARELLRTEDLDPVYCMAVAGIADEDRWDKRCCFLVSYWHFYHVGAAARLCDHWADPSGWRKAMRELAAVKAGPRGMERRHFRGEAAMKAIDWLDVTRMDPQKMVRWLIGDGMKYATVADKLLTVPMFGPWIAWKAADMMERILGLPIDFSAADLSMYREPARGAALLIKGDPDAAVAPDEMKALCAMMASTLSDRMAPPRYERRINLQEVETVLCKYKAYRGGHYHVGKDIEDSVKALKAWPSETGNAILKVFRGA